MSKVYQLLEEYYDTTGYTELSHIVWEMYQDGEIDEDEYEIMKDDEDAHYDLQSLVYDRRSAIELEWEQESRDLERWYQRSV
jgi:hypothetical protein